MDRTRLGRISRVGRKVSIWVFLLFCGYLFAFGLVEFSRSSELISDENVGVLIPFIPLGVAAEQFPAAGYALAEYADFCRSCSFWFFGRKVYVHKEGDPEDLIKTQWVRD